MLAQSLHQSLKHFSDHLEVGTAVDLRYSHQARCKSEDPDGSVDRHFVKKCALTRFSPGGEKRARKGVPPLTPLWNFVRGYLSLECIASVKRTWRQCQGCRSVPNALGKVRAREERPRIRRSWQYAELGQG